MTGRDLYQPGLPGTDGSDIHTDTLNVMGGKWKLPILLALGNGNRRFNQLKHYLGNITSRTLTRELRELEMNKSLFASRICLPAVN